MTIKAEQLEDTIYHLHKVELPVWRLVFRRNDTTLIKHKPVTTYIHAKDLYEAKMYGYQMARSISHEFLDHETELVEIGELKCMI